MSRLVCVAGAVSLALCLSGCGDDNSTKNSENDAGNNKAEKVPGGGKCLLQQSLNGWYVSVAALAGAGTQGGCNGMGSCEVFDSQKLIPVTYPSMEKDDKAVLYGFQGDDAVKFNNKSVVVKEVAKTSTPIEQPTKYLVEFDESIDGLASDELWVNAAFVRQKLEVGDYVRGGLWSLTSNLNIRTSAEQNAMNGLGERGVSEKL